jgi:hypothetical protein
LSFHLFILVSVLSVHLFIVVIVLTKKKRWTDNTMTK